MKTEKIFARTAEQMAAELAQVRERLACGILQNDKTCWRCGVGTREWYSNHSFTTERRGRYVS